MVQQMNNLIILYGMFIITGMLMLILIGLCKVANNTYGPGQPTECMISYSLGNVSLSLDVVHV